MSSISLLNYQVRDMSGKENNLWKNYRRYQMKHKNIIYNM